MASTFTEMLELAERLGVCVRHADLGGTGGGLAHVKGKRLLFVDLDADPEDQLEKTAHALGQLQELETTYVRPDVREVVDRYRTAN